ncbi:MAG: serine hydrolase domain-containing protein, partial [Gemmatimonadota bacterium]
MRQLLVTGVLLLLASAASSFRALAAQAQETGALSTLTPAEGRRIDSIFRQLDNTRSPGCALGVIEEGALPFARGYGMANLEHGIAINARTIFRTGSVSKQFTAGTVVLLAGEGAFSLDDDIRIHFPELPEYEAPIRVRHLLHHTSGLRDYLELMAMRGVGDEATYSEDDVVALLARQKALNFPPGSEFLYSNSGYVLLSRLVERTTGQTLREQAERLLFWPLGMKSTHYHDDHHEIVPGRATGYGLGPQGRFVVDQTTLDIVGDGGVFTSVEEVSRWMANFWALDVGGEAWLSQLEGRGVLTTGDTVDYALGLRHGTQRGLPYVGHGGAFVGYRAATLRYPGEDLAVVVLCNYGLTDPMSMAMGVGEVLLEDRMEPLPERGAEPGSGTSPPSDPPPPLSPEEERSLLGEYYSEEVDATLRILKGESGLTVDLNGAWDLPLLPVGPDRFRAQYLTLSLVRDPDGVTGLRVGSGRAGGVWFAR